MLKNWKQGRTDSEGGGAEGHEKQEGRGAGQLTLMGGDGEEQGVAADDTAVDVGGDGSSNTSATCTH